MTGHHAVNTPTSSTLVRTCPNMAWINPTGSASAGPATYWNVRKNAWMNRTAHRFISKPRNSPMDICVHWMIWYMMRCLMILLVKQRHCISSESLIENWNKNCQVLVGKWGSFIILHSIHVTSIRNREGETQTFFSKLFFVFKALK